MKSGETRSGQLSVQNHGACTVFDELYHMIDRVIDITQMGRFWPDQLDSHNCAISVISTINSILFEYAEFALCILHFSAYSFDF